MGCNCCGFVVGPGYRAFVDRCNPEERWIASMAEAQEADCERRRFEAEPLRLDRTCDQCGRQMHEDTPGVLECLCGERLRTMAATKGAQDHE